MPRYFVTPWRTTEELLTVRDQLFGDRTANKAGFDPTDGRARTDLDPRYDRAAALALLTDEMAQRWSDRRGGLDRIGLWRFRSDSLPHAIDCTADFFEAKELLWRIRRTEALLDEELLAQSEAKKAGEYDEQADETTGTNEKHNNLVSLTTCASRSLEPTFATAIHRFITGFCDTAQSGAVKTPMYVVGAQLGFSASWIELRHLIAHGGTDMPCIEQLEEITNDMLVWLWTRFWLKLDTDPSPRSEEPNLEPVEIDRKITAGLKAFRTARIESIREEERARKTGGTTSRKRKSNGGDTQPSSPSPSPSRPQSGAKKPRVDDPEAASPSGSSETATFWTPLVPTDDECAEVSVDRNVASMLKMCSATVTASSESTVVSSLVSSLVRPKMLIPASEQSSSLTGAFLIWDPLLAALDVRFPTTFTTALVDRLARPAIKCSIKTIFSDRTDSDDSDCEIDTEAGIKWIVHLLDPVESPIKIPSAIFTSTCLTCVRNPNKWTSRLMLDIVSIHMPDLNRNRRDPDGGPDARRTSEGVVRHQFSIWTNTMKMYLSQESDINPTESNPTSNSTINGLSGKGEGRSSKSDEDEQAVVTRYRQLERQVRQVDDALEREISDLFDRMDRSVKMVVAEHVQRAKTLKPPPPPVPQPGVRPIDIYDVERIFYSEDEPDGDEDSEDSDGEPKRPRRRDKVRGWPAPVLGAWEGVPIGPYVAPSL